MFVDTSGWLCYFDKSQPQHGAATVTVALHLAANGVLLTTNYVIAELIALLNSRTRMSRIQIIACVETLKTSADINIFHIDRTLDEAAWHLLKTREDKDWSLCDAASFAVMQQQNLTNALTTDHHFEQAGFNRLLK